MGNRSGRQGGGDVEPSAATYGATIVALVVLAAAVLLWGCGDDRLKSNDGKALIEPGRVEFGLVRVGDRAGTQVKLVNRGDAPLGIVGFEPQGELPPDFRLPALPDEAIPVSAEVPLDFGFHPTQEGPRNAVVVLRTNSYEQPSLRLELSGEAARPVVSASERLEFGKVVLNTDKVLRITVLNVGRVQARVAVAGVGGEDASHFAVGENLTGGAVDIAPQGTALVEVRYVAAHLGPASAVAHLRVEGAAEPDLSVELNGEGFASDLVSFPACLDFGSVSPNAISSPKTLTIYNGGNDPVAFQPPEIVAGSDVFTVVGVRVEGQPGDLVTLGAGESAEIDVAFKPAGLGKYDGELSVRSDDRINPRLTACLTGRGGGANIHVFPDELDFGQATPGMAVTIPIVVTNVGTGEGGPLRITGFSWEGPGQGAFVAPLLPAPDELTTADPSRRYDVTFRPVQPGFFSATLYVESTDGDTPRYPVTVTGESRELPPCQWVAEPPVLRFGQVAVGATATLGIALRNVGTDECIFSSVALARGAPAAFSLPDGAVPSATVAPGERLVIPVAATPAAAGDVSTNLTFFVSDPAQPSGAVAITATGYQGCLVAQPGSIDFGQTRVSCPPVRRSMTLYNQCGGDVELSSVALGAGIYTPGEFGVAAAAPGVVPGGGTTTVEVTYDPVDAGFDGAPVTIEADALAAPLSLPLAGTGTLTDERTDRFQQQSRQAVDVLFVIDNSGSMMEEQEAMGAAFDDFIGYAISQGLDYRIGVTTTGIDPSGGGWATCPGSVDGGEAGRLFPADGVRPRWIDPSTPNGAAVFAENAKVGVCHWWEEGLEAAYLALTTPLVDGADDPSTPIRNDGNLGFYRPDARLAVIVVTDEDDHSDRPASFYASFFRSLKGLNGAGKVTVSGVLGNGCATSSGDGVKYQEVIDATGGIVEPICTANWGESLAKLAEASFGFTLRFPLSGEPEGAIQVTVDGQVRGGWTYDAAQNAVVFTEATAPAPGTRVEITYVPACGT